MFLNKKKLYILFIFLIILLTFLFFLIFHNCGNSNIVNDTVGNLSKEPKRIYDCGAIDCGKKVKSIDF